MGSPRDDLFKGRVSGNEIEVGLYFLRPDTDNIVCPAERSVALS